VFESTLDDTVPTGLDKQDTDFRDAPRNACFQSVPAIATEFHISQQTVRNHLKSIYRQLSVGNQSELIEHIRNLDDPKS
jgi:hypothetical protein